MSSLSATGELDDAHLAVVSQGELVRFGLQGGVGDDHVAPDQAVLDALRDGVDPAVFQNDAVLDLAALHHHVVVNGCERPDVGIHDAAPLADDGRAADHAVDNLRPLLDRHPRIDV